MNAPLQALAGKRIPELDRVPTLLPIGGNWFTVVYNPGDDTTYRAEMRELPFVQINDAFRVVQRGKFATEWSLSQMRPGRYSRITNRTGTRPTSDIVVQELGGKKLGLALELYPDVINPVTLGEVRLVRYNPSNDTIADFGLGGAVGGDVRRDSYAAQVAGPQTITLTAATFVYSVGLEGINGTLDGLRESKGWTFANGQLQILAAVNASSTAVFEIVHNGTGIGGNPSPTAPAAPTAPITNDADNYFLFYPSGYVAPGTPLAPTAPTNSGTNFIFTPSQY